MSKTLLIDTDVIIDDLRGQADAVKYLESLAAPQSFSAVTVAELYAGVREGHERKVSDAFLKAFEILPIDEGRPFKAVCTAGTSARAIMSVWPT